MTTKSSVSKDTTRVWLISGPSSGFGHALAEAVLAKGERVILAARRPESVQDLTQRYPERARVVALDVAKREMIVPAVNDALQAFGQVDVLVNNAGYSIIGALEEISDAELREQMETNFFGVFLLTQALLPHMRQRRKGHILNVSSVSGLVGMSGLAAYSASKFAIEGLSESLAQEVAPYGIHVTLVEPDSFRTGSGGRSELMHAQHLMNEYKNSVGRTISTMMGKQPGDPARAAQVMIQAVESDAPPLHLLLGQNAIEMTERKLQSLQADIQHWQTAARETAFTSGQPGA
jgi:NAD(P)-dependent dehydrogenase (short-subunit alcohol dehydrogenase family)